jgi:hypothetical protein
MKSEVFSRRVTISAAGVAQIHFWIFLRNVTWIERDEDGRKIVVKLAK